MRRFDSRRLHRSRKSQGFSRAGRAFPRLAASFILDAADAAELVANVCRARCRFRLAYCGAQELQRKLVWFYSAWVEDDLDSFDPPDGLTEGSA